MKHLECFTNKFAKINHKYLLWGSVGFISTYILGSQINKYLGEKKMDRIAQKKRKCRDQQIEEYRVRHVKCSLSEELKAKVLNSTIRQIQQMYYDGETTITQVLLLFIERTIDIAYPMNIITEINFDAALQLAKEQDELLKKDREILKTKELFGIPVSVKEMYIQKGFDSTFGIAKKCFKPHDYDGIQVAQIKMAGGIIFVRTNVPQLAMAFESVNNIFGRAQNPWDTTRATGGSSGGEAAIHAARCSVIGIGSDIGGSIRIPAAFCGVYGLKPCMVRQTSVGEVQIMGAVKGHLNIKPSKGPLGRSVEDLETMMRVLLNAENYEKLTLEQKDLYWSPQELQPLPTKAKLRVGFLTELKLFTPAKCMSRAVILSKDALLNLGHEVVPFELDEQFQQDLATIFPQLVSAEGDFQSFNDNIHGEKMIKEYELLKQGCYIPQWVNRYIFRPLLDLFGQKCLANVINFSYKKSTHEFLKLSGLQREINQKLYVKMKEQGLDGLIMPAFAYPALKHTYSTFLTLGAIYTWMWNTIDFPVGSMPVTVVEDEKDATIPGKEKSRDIIYATMRDTMAGSVGLPVNIQVISYPHQEEMCLRIMKDIEKQVKFNTKHSYPF